MKPVLVLTRPEPQSRAIASVVGEDVPVVISPVMRIVAMSELPDPSGYAGVILTSANAVVAGLDLAGRRAFCVGRRTADAAAEAGADVRLIARDADDLLERIESAGPLLHLRGEHARGNIAMRLSSGGIETDEAVVYAQNALALSARALSALAGTAPVVLPLYSPRSARLVGEQVGVLGPEVRAIAMSAAVEEAWRTATGASAQVVPEPTGESMLEGILSAVIP